MEEKRREAANNKLDKETKRTDKADAKTKEQANRDIIEEIRKDNLTNLESIRKKMEKIEDAIVNTLKDGIKEALKDVATTLADAVKDGINQKEDKEDNLATQKLIKNIETMNERLNNESRRSQAEPSSLIFNPIPDPEPEKKKKKKIPSIYPVITKDELCKTINVMINRISELEDENLRAKD